jgi:glycogen synthase
VNVLLTADTAGGVWYPTLALARAFHARGIGVTCAAMGPPLTASQQHEARALPGLTVHAAELRLPWMDEPWEDVTRAGAWLLELGASADLVHLSEPVFGALPWAVPSVAVAHSCVLSWFAAVRGEPAPPTWDRYRLAMTHGLRSADAVVAPSRAMLAAVRRHYGTHGGTVVPNGRAPGRYASGVKEPFVLTAGRLWDEAKNVGLLAEVAPRLSWPILAAGDTQSPDGGAVEPGGLRLLGPLGPEAMADRFARAAIYALPARYEPFGQSILEAALSGCALVLGDIPSLRELWEGVALFVSPDDHAALHVALDSLIRDPDLRRTLATRARRRALGYSAERMADGYLAIYSRLMAQRDPGGRTEVPACAS